MIREEHRSESDWLEARYRYLTASDAASIMGDSPWKSASELFDEKKRNRLPKDISNSPAVIFGKRAEEHIRAMAMLDLPYFDLAYHPYDLLISEEYLASDEHPFIACTLDGELTVATDDNPWMLEKGTRGILECKTGSWRRERDLESWEFVPCHYVWQGIHQLLATDWDFVLFAARVKRDGYRDDDQGFPEVKTYYRLLDRRSMAVREQMKDLLEAEVRFKKDLERNRRPARLIRF